MRPGSGALFSQCGQYRYKLWRQWATGPGVTWVMLNPSTADADVDDPTIRRCIGFAKEWGAGRIDVVNLFAYRATDPEKLKKVPDPIGLANDAILMEMAHRGSGIMVAAWGLNGNWWGRSYEVLQFLTTFQTVFCLGYCKNGEPRHPLMLAGDTGLEVMERPL